MKVSGSYSLATEPERAYDLLQDPNVLARCMPGCKDLEKTGDNEYRMKMRTVIGAVAGDFEGTVRIADPSPPTSFRLIVEGSGRIGFLKGDGLLNLTRGGEGTDVAYDGEVQVGGTIAGVGQRLLDSTSRIIIKRFFGSLSKEVGDETNPSAAD